MKKYLNKKIFNKIHVFEKNISKITMNACLTYDKYSKKVHFYLQFLFKSEHHQKKIIFVL